MNLSITTKITTSDIANRKNELPASLSRRVPTVFQAAFLATKDTFANNSLLKPTAIICISELGCLNETISFLDKLNETAFGSPKDFVFSVHNSLGAMLAKEFSITGANITLTDKNIEKAIDIADILDENTVLIVQFDDGNKFAEKVLLKTERNPCAEAFAQAFLYTK